MVIRFKHNCIFKRPFPLRSTPDVTSPINVLNPFRLSTLISDVTSGVILKGKGLLVTISCTRCGVEREGEWGEEREWCGVERGRVW